MTPRCAQIVLHFPKGHSHTLKGLDELVFLEPFLCGASHILQSAVSGIITVFQPVYGTKRSEQKSLVHRKQGRGNYLFRAELPKHAQQREGLDFSSETSLIHLAGFQLTAISVEPLNYLECCNQSASF